MHKLLSKIITRMKGEKFVLDENIPISYMVRLFVNRLLMLVVGVCKLRRLGKIFVHHSSKVLCCRKIILKGNFTVDRNCYIDALSVEGIVLGSNVSIGKNTSIECTGTLKSLGKGLRVGNNVGLGTHGFLGCAGGIEIGDDTILGNYVSMHSENHNYADTRVPIRLQGVNRKGIIIGKDCWIGAKVIILDGTRINDGCIVAAGAVVRGEFPPYSIIGGVPAKMIKSRLKK